MPKRFHVTPIVNSGSTTTMNFSNGLSTMRKRLISSSIFSIPAELKASVPNDVLQPKTVTLGCRPSSRLVLFQGVHVPLEDILGVVCHTISGNGDSNFSSAVDDNLMSLLSTAP